MDVPRRFSSGQSLIEILVGIAIGAVLIVSVVSVIVPALQANKQAAQVQTKTELANEVAGNVKAWATGNWNNILALATGTVGTYYLSAATSSFVAVSGSAEAVAVGSTTYNRYFYLLDVYRDASGNVTTTVVGNNYDPSTKLITVVVNMSGTQASASTTLSFYLTRNSNNNFNQVSWAGGGGQNGPITFVGTSFASSSNVAISATGSLQLAAGNTCVQ